MVAEWFVFKLHRTEELEAFLQGTGIDADNVRHIVPDFTEPHVVCELGADCWCAVSVETLGLNGGAVVTHRENN